MNNRRVFFLPDGQYAFGQNTEAMVQPEGYSVSYAVADNVSDELWQNALRYGQSRYAPVIDGETVTDIIEI